MPATCSTGILRAFKHFSGFEFFLLSRSISPAHKRPDEVVFAAYGWKSDLSDEEILEKLLALNLERVKKR
jgi:hypothetical protein